MKTKAVLFFAILAAFIASILLVSCGSDSITGSLQNGQAGYRIMASQRDTDGDGIIDIIDTDDDNDGIPDDLDSDDDNDGILDDDEEDLDGDDIIDDHDDNFMELEGFIENKSSSSLVVFGTMVLVNDSTKIEREEDIPLDFSDLLVGMRVEVHGFVVVTDTVNAVEIDVENEDEQSSPEDSLDVN